MYRQTLRSTPRAASALCQTVARAAPRRFASTAPADKPRSWKGAALRWGLAGGALYYYNTSNAFAEEPLPSTFPEPPHFSDSDLKTVDAVIEEKRQKTSTKTREPAPTPAAAAPSTAAEPIPAAGPGAPELEPGSPEAGQQGAFNPETGEINWDCPCLGGMADGPCGEEFKAAFSCFVYSEEEPKGIECIDKFQGMQECFRKHPEIYANEIADDDEAEGARGETSPSVGDAAAAPEKAAPKEEKKSAADAKHDENTAAATKEAEELAAAPKSTDSIAPAKAAETAPASAPTDFYDATAANKEAK